MLIALVVIGVLIVLQLAEIIKILNLIRNEVIASSLCDQQKLHK